MTKCDQKSNIDSKQNVNAIMFHKKSIKSQVDIRE